MAIAGPFKLTGKLKLLKFNKGRFTREMEIRGRRLMREAAIAFLNASTERIPKRTSFARGGFDNLGTALGVKGREGPRNTVPRPGGEYYYLSKKRRVRKSREAGTRFSTTASIEKIIQTNFTSSVIGRAIAFSARRKPTFNFEYRVSINYIAINEGRWQALQAGTDAFRLVLAANATKVIPKLVDFTETADLTVEG